MLFISLAAAANLAACDFGARHPDAPEELNQYGFLVGNHTVRAYRWNAAQNDWLGYLETEWNGWWALGGYAIADEWYDVQFPNQPPALGRGINIRMWDSENARWSNMWMHTRKATTTELHSRVEDGNMVMYQVYPETTAKTRIEFEVHDDGTWSRFTYAEGEDGALTPTGRLDGIKKACAPSPNAR